MATKPAKKQNDKPKAQMKTGCGDIVRDFIEDVWQVMTPEMVDHLKCILTEDMGMAKKDADKFIAYQREIRRERLCLKKDNRVVIRIGPRNQWIKELSKDIGNQIALFVVGILLSNRNARTKRITEKVLDHLCEITGENTTMDSAKTRVERTMVVVADRMAAWIDEAVTDIESKMKDRFLPADDLSIVTAESSETESTATDGSICDTLLTSRESLLLRRETFSDKSMILEEREADTETEEEEKGNEELTDEEKSEEGSEESTGVRETEDEHSEEEVDEESDAVEEEEDTEEVKSEQEEAEEEEGEQEEEGEEDEEETPSVRSEEESEEGIGDKLEASLETLPSSGRPTSVEVTVGDQGRLSDVASEEKQMLVDFLELLKEDFRRIPKEGEKTDRQKAMKKVIDRRFEKIVREKLDRSLDSFVKYDIDEAASTVANWIERVLAAAEACPVVPSVIRPDLKQGSAFEIMRGDGSQYKVLKLSSATVAQKVATMRGLEPPLRKKKIPRTMSPMNLKSTRDWADWALGATKVGEEWGGWLDKTFTEVERQLLSDRGSTTRVERYEEWRNWKSKRGVEAIKWRVEKQRIKDEAALWSRKLQKEFHKPEKETRTFSY